MWERTGDRFHLLSGPVALLMCVCAPSLPFSLSAFLSLTMRVRTHTYRGQRLTSVSFSIAVWLLFEQGLSLNLELAGQQAPGTTDVRSVPEDVNSGSLVRTQ